MFTKKTRVISAIATVCMLISMLACIAVPAHAVEIDPSTYLSVQTVKAAITPDTTANYSVSSVADWEYLANNIDWFNDDDIVIHLTTDLDMSSTSFLVMDDPYFSVDGHNHTFKNWGKSDAPVRSNGIFRYNSNEGRMKFIKNLVIDNCHNKYNHDATAASALLVSFEGLNSGQENAAAEFTIENVHIKNSSVVGIGNCNSVFISGYATKSWDYTLNIKNCSLIDTTLTAGPGGHSGLLIGKLSDNDNGKNGVVNLTNIYVKGNTFKAGRDRYDTLLIGNAEGGNVKVTLNNIYAGGNTVIYKANQIGYIINAGNGRGGMQTNCQNTSVNGVVLQDNNVSTTDEAARGFVTTTWGGTATLTDVYCNDTAVTYNNAAMAFASNGNTPLTAKVGDSYMTSGEAAYALNKNATADSAFWYTTTAEGVELGTVANATRKVTVKLANGTLLPTMYVNGGDTVAFKYPANVIEGAATIENGILTMGTTGDVVVQVDLTDEEYEEYKKEIAKSELKETIDYFEARNLDYYVAAAATALANAKSVYEAAGSGEAAYKAVNDELKAYKTQYAITKDHAPSVSEIDIYPAAPVYVIYSKEDFEKLASRASALNVDDMIYMRNDVDMTGTTFKGVVDLKASFDGCGYSIKNWGSASAPVGTQGMFQFKTGAGMKSIKNLTFENCYTGTTGGDNALLVTLCGADNAGRPNMASEFLMENVHVKNCTLTASGARSGFLIANYVKSDGAYSVNLKSCSITGSILTDMTGNGHSGLLIGKASSFNDKAATYNFSNIYVANNILNCKRNMYVGLGIGNVEIDSTKAVPAQMQVNMNSVVFKGNTINSVSATPRLFGEFVATGLTTNGVVFDDNTVISTVPETARTIFSSGGNNHNISGIYYDDASITAVCGTGAIGEAKFGDEYMTSGEAAWAANKAATADSLLWFTTDRGVKLGDASNATHKITLEDSNGQEVGVVYGNAGTQVDVASPEFDNYALKAGSNGSIDGSVVTMPENSDVTVVVSLSEQGALIIAKRFLQEAIDYFKVDRNLSYFNNAVATAVAEAESLMGTTDITKAQEVLDKVEALEALKTGNYAGTPENAPGFTEATLYPNAPLYVLREAADFDALKAMKSNFTDADTIYMVNDIDMKGSGFNGIVDLKASFDGQGYKIKNWGIAADGETKAAINTQGLFYNSKDGNAVCYSYIKSIKDVTFENCHTTSGASYGAMLLGVNHNNGGLTGGATTLDLSNIHFVNCSMTATGGEVYAFLLTRYAHQTGNATINITNCSVTGSTINGGGCNHVGLLTAKPRGGNSKPSVYNIKDCYVGGNTYNTSRAWSDDNPETKDINESLNNYGGLILGTVEASNTTVNLTNIGAVGNTVNISGSGNYFNLLACTQNSTIKTDGVMIAGTTITGNTNASVYVVNGGAANHTLDNFYCDATLTAVASHKADLAITSEQVGASTAWLLNTKSAGNLWWTTDAGKALKGTKDNATRKVDLKLSDGEIVETYYVNVGSTQELDYAGFEGESFEYEGAEAIIKGNALTLNMNADVVVKVKLDGGELIIEAANVKTNEEIKVTIKVSSDTYGVSSLAFDLIYDPSLTLKSDKNLNYFDTVTVNDDGYGKISITAANIENIKGEVGIVELIFEPANAEATLQFDAIVNAHAKDAEGTEKSVEMDCEGKTVYSYDQTLIGDVNKDGSVELSDVINILRVLVGSLNIEHIDVEAANIYVDDGYTDNYGINTSDAIKILEIAMENS